MTDTQVIADAADRLDKFREIALQQRADEEGCGALLAAISYPQVRISHRVDTSPFGEKFRQYQDDEPF